MSANVEAQITWLDAVIVGYRTALIDFGNDGAMVEYKFDTGQQVITVSRTPPAELNALIRGWMNEREMLCVRSGLSTASSVNGRSA